MKMPMPMRHCEYMNIKHAISYFMYAAGMSVLVITSPAYSDSKPKYVIAGSSWNMTQQ